MSSTRGRLAPTLVAPGRSWLAIGQRTRGYGAVGALALLYTAFLTRSLGNPLTEYHSFRQTQTAFVTRSFGQSGIDLLRPIVPIFGPHASVPFDMPWYEAIASVVASVFHVSEIVALRSTSLAFSVLTAVFALRLAHRLGGRSAGVAAMALFLFCPLTLQWGRASLIESFTTAMTIGWVLTVIRLDDEQSPRNIVRVLGIAAGVLAATSKITTFLPWGLLILPTFARDLRARRVIPLVWTLTSSGIALTAGLAWTRHADHVKAASRFTESLTSSSVQRFTLGTVEQRLSVSTWGTIFGRTVVLIIGPVGLLLLVLAAVRSRYLRHRIDIAALAAVPLAAFVAFTNLYEIHDYYLVAIAPAFAVLNGIVSAASNGIERRGRRIDGRTLVCVSVAACLFAGGPYIRRIFVGAADLRALSDSAASITQPDGGVVVTGLGWNPEILYNAHRWGVAVDGQTGTPDELMTSPFVTRIEALVAANGIDAPTRAVIERADWVAPIDQFTYKIAFDPRGRAEPTIADDDPTVLAVLRPRQQASAARGQAMELPCDGKAHRLASSTLAIDADQPHTVLGSDRWVLPAIRGLLTLKTPTLQCAGPPSSSVRLRVLSPGDGDAVMPAP